jgi:membrane protease YdiL (CAAX protease family)
MCLLYETTGTIVAPIVTHAFFNAANYTYLVLSKS